MNRRHFLNKSVITAGLLGIGNFPFEAFASKEYTKLTLLHTNDVHSRIEPFPAGSKYAGMGGAAARAAIIERIRREEENVLLLDCGDIFQGTPYFNYFGGQLEIELMSKMGYDACAVGNHDFDAGLNGLDRQLPYANFPFLAANYDFSDTLLDGKIKNYQVFEKGPLKVGIFGLGIKLEGLVPEKLYGNTKYSDPIKVARATSNFLKKELNCNLVVCLSHLGYKYQNRKVSDIFLAEENSCIDIILGGHTHTFFDKPEVIKNKRNEATIINQVGWAGIILGRLDIVFDKKLSKKEFFFDTVKVY